MEIPDSTHVGECTPDQNGLLLHSVHNVISLVPAAVAPDREEGKLHFFPLKVASKKRVENFLSNEGSCLQTFMNGLIIDWFSQKLFS